MAAASPTLIETRVSLPSAPGAREIAGLTGIRALAAWWVVLMHLRALGFVCGIPRVDRLLSAVLVTGNLGVDLFFVLSGFVIAYNYWQKFTSFHAAQYRKFLWMRLARMYPVHVATLLGTLALYTAARMKGGPLRIGGGWTAAQFLQHLLLVQHWSLHPILSWNTVSWSISCEWLAYLAFPLIVCGLTGRHFPRTLGGVSLAAMLLLGAAFQRWRWVWTDAGTLRIAVSFLTGVAVFQLWKKYGQVRRNAWFANGALLLALSSVLASVRFPGISPYWITFTFPCLIYGLACGEGLVAHLLSTKLAVFWGRVSYSLYMTHVLTMLVLVRLVAVSGPHPSLLGMAVRAAFYLAVIALAAVATFRLVEEPARDRMRGWLRRSKPDRPAAFETVAPAA